MSPIRTDILRSVGSTRASVSFAMRILCRPSFDDPVFTIFRTHTDVVHHIPHALFFPVFDANTTNKCDGLFARKTSRRKLAHVSPDVGRPILGPSSPLFRTVDFSTTNGTQPIRLFIFFTDRCRSSTRPFAEEVLHVLLVADAAGPEATMIELLEPAFSPGVLIAPAAPERRRLLLSDAAHASFEIFAKNLDASTWRNI